MKPSEYWLRAVNIVDERLKALPKERIQEVLGIKEYKGLNEAQYKFVIDIGEDLLPIGFQGSVGGGKSFSLVFKLYISAMIPNNKLIVFRKYQLDLIDTTFYDTFIPFVTLLGGMTKDLVGDKRANPYTLMDNGTKIFWKGLFGKTGTKVEKSRLGSTAYGAVFVDEAQELLDPQPIMTLISRLRWPAGKGFFHLSMVYNPPREAAWLGKHRQKGILRVYECPVSLNLANLPPDYIDRMKKLYPETWKKKFLEGKTGTLPQGVPAYDFSSIHLKKFEYNPHLPLIRGWDLGSNVGVCLISQYDNSPRLCLLDMILVEDSWTRPLAKLVKQVSTQKYPHSVNMINLDFVDGVSLPQRHASSEYTNQDILIQEGYNPVGVYVTHDVRQERINDAICRLVKGSPFVVIEEEQHDLYSALSEGYCVDEKGKIIKDSYFEHIGDAFTFLAMGLFADLFNPGVTKINYKRFKEDLDMYVSPEMYVKRV